jgi:phage repressor protein C with HTH and peptisase S24 domain
MVTNDERQAFSARLNQALDAAGVPPKTQGRQTAVGKMFGVTQKGARKWLEAEAIPETKRLPQIAAKLAVSVEWLLTGRPPRDYIDGEVITPRLPAPETLPGSRIVAWDGLVDLPEGSAYIVVPHFDVRLSAGDGADAEWMDHPDNEPIPVPARVFRAHGAHPQRCHALYVRGASMEPTLLDGDTVLIDTARTEVQDDALFALLYHGELYIKRLFRLPGGGVELRSDNPRHRSQEVRGADLAALRVLGRTIWRAG